MFKHISMFDFLGYKHLQNAKILRVKGMHSVQVAEFMYDLINHSQVLSHKNNLAGEICQMNE